MEICGSRQQKATHYSLHWRVFWAYTTVVEGTIVSPLREQEESCSFVIRFVVCMTAAAISNSYVSYVSTACLRFCKDTVVNVMSNVQLLGFGHWKTKGVVWLDVTCGMLVSPLTWRIPSFSAAWRFFLLLGFKMIHERHTLFKLTWFSTGWSKLIWLVKSCLWWEIIVFFKEQINFSTSSTYSSWFVILLMPA